MFKRIAYLLVLLAILSGCNIFQAPAVPAFYDPPSPLPAGKPGDIIKTEVMKGAPRGIKAWRVLYHSTTLDGQDIAVSAAFFAPDKPAPANGFPILAQAHGTTGIARGCAPTIQPFKVGLTGVSFYDEHVEPFLDAGYAVTLPDYQGMGAPGTLSYLIGELEGKNTLDSIRALKNFSEIKTSLQIFVWGHSQGGQAAAFTSQLAASYAPEIPLTGVVTLAPAVELKALVEHAFDDPKRAVTTGLMLMVVEAWTQAYPELQDAPLLKPNANVSSVLEDCVLGAILSTFKSPTDYFTASPLTSPAWTARIAENTPDPKLLRVPMFIGQGAKDQVVYPPTVQAFAKSVCENGTPVFFKFYENAGHIDLPKYATADTLSWMQELLQGKPPPSNC